jgi:hypothetical protein
MQIYASFLGYGCCEPEIVAKENLLILLRISRFVFGPVV